MSESWVGKNLFCPSCGNPHLSNLPNNMPVADLRCEHCGEVYELKSKKGKFGNKITAGDYSAMIHRITSSDNPDLILMEYTDDLQVNNIIFIPKFFLVSSMIEKRKPLSSDARRSGWTGCNILYSKIPEQGKIIVINNQLMSDKKSGC